jgi:hypothetical protein
MRWPTVGGRANIEDCSLEVNLQDVRDGNRKKKTVKQTRQTFTCEFKQQAVQMMLDGYHVSLFRCLSATRGNG